jgi:hypothetical protein
LPLASEAGKQKENPISSSLPFSSAAVVMATDSGGEETREVESPAGGGAHELWC